MRNKTTRSKQKLIHRKRNAGMASVEMLFIFATFVLAMFTFMKLGMYVAQAFFSDGNQMLASPLI